MLYIFDFEVFAYDWLVVFKCVETGDFTVFHNDNDGLKEFMQEDMLLAGFNNKHYDNHILKAILCGAEPDLVKEINDYIMSGKNGWEHWFLRENKAYFNSFDLHDDMQDGLSLKSIEAHLGMDIRESDVDFNIDRPLTPEELDETTQYCKHDVTATEQLYHLRKNYLTNKMTLGDKKKIPLEKALYMTNAKLTAAYLDAVLQQHNDEREYKYPPNILMEYIPPEIIAFFDRIHDKNIPDEVLFLTKYDFSIGECQCTIGWGGAHGAIPNYREKSSDIRSIRNQDVASYYPHLMTIDGYCSRNIPDAQIYADMLETRMAAKKSGDKSTAAALKLVANTTYGAMLNAFNDLYDPLMGRSVCITGQLRLIELAEHLITECLTLKVVQLNTDGIMVSLDNSDIETYSAICREWQERTGFELEEDCISEIVQKDVNNYIEIATDGGTKIKGGWLVRGISEAGAWNINNNTVIVAKALIDYFAKGIPVEETINNCNEPLQFQLIAKASSKYLAAYHIVNGEKVKVQKCNRVYATKNRDYGTLVKTHAISGRDVKVSGLPPHCIIDNNNEATIDLIDKSWYIRLAKKQVKEFLGIKPPKKNTRKINCIKKRILKLLEE